MKLTYDCEKILMGTGLFKSKTDIIIFLLMKLIHESIEPVGAWVLGEHLLDCGINCSTATVGRYLKTLDYRKFTTRQGNQGRILTPEGIAALDKLEKLVDRAQVQNKLSQSIQINEYNELLDLLRARKALEAEAARLASKNASVEEMEELRQAVKVHKQYVEENRDPTEPAFDFHATVARMSHNKFIIALLNMLIFEEKKIELLFDTLVTRERGRIYVQEHEQITDAIIRRNAEHAAKLMDSHIKELYQTIGKQAHDLL